MKAKFRLGEALLTLIDKKPKGGEGDAVILCYDPGPRNEIFIEREVAYDVAQNVKNGDKINMRVRNFSASSIRIAFGEKRDRRYR